VSEIAVSSAPFDPFVTSLLDTINTRHGTSYHLYAAVDATVRLVGYAFLFLLLWLLPQSGNAGSAPSAQPTASPSPTSSLSSWTSSQAEPIAGNPGAVNVEPGIGLLGRTLGFGPDSGVFLGGVWVGNGDYLIGGGVDPRSWKFNSLGILGTDLDFQKLIGLPGGEFGADFLVFDGQAANSAAGTVTGYDGLTGPPPLDRTELFQLWWRQRLFGDKLFIRVGKVVPIYDFNNVVRPVPMEEPSRSIPAVTGLIYTAIFTNPTMLGAIPGYYNSAYGITTTFTPTKNFYASYGVYDGSLANGRQTGISAVPDFSGYYFQIGELGGSWLLGPDSLPGSVGLGGWGQTGRLTAGKGPSAVTQNGTGGFYTFGQQRLWLRHPGVDNSGINSLFQFGINDSRTMLASEYFGLGLTGFGLVPHRESDSVGVGSAWSWLNRLPGSGFRSNELILQVYYQALVFGGVSFQPTFSYIPNPGASTSVQGATALTLQSTILF
jgi:porin